MRYVLDKERSEKQRKIIEAEGEAESIKRKAAALKANPQLIQYEYVNKISPGIKTIITDQNAIMNLPSSMFENK
jgi:regulator of protease activity HflC (stomatin/prohibitin superfamily)